jgi:hypothetical protein
MTCPDGHISDCGLSTIAAKPDPAVRSVTTCFRQERQVGFARIGAQCKPANICVALASKASGISRGFRRSGTHTSLTVFGDQSRAPRRRSRSHREDDAVVRRCVRGQASTTDALSRAERFATFGWRRAGSSRSFTQPSSQRRRRRLPAGKGLLSRERSSRYASLPS